MLENQGSTIQNKRNTYPQPPPGRARARAPRWGAVDTYFFDFVSYFLGFQANPATTYALLWISQSSPMIIRSSGVGYPLTPIPGRGCMVEDKPTHRITHAHLMSRLLVHSLRISGPCLCSLDKVAKARSKKSAFCAGPRQAPWLPRVPG